MTKQVKAAVEICKALEDVIVNATEREGGIPSGHLFAMVMEHLDIETYSKFIDLLVKSGRVKRAQSHMLTSTKVAKRGLFHGRN